MRESQRVGVIGWPQATNVMLVARWQSLGIPVELLEPEQALAKLEQGDIAVARLDVLPTLDGVEPGLEVLDELAARGVRIVNDRLALLAAHDKLVTARVLEGAGIPAPKTEHLVCSSARPGMLPPLVVKPRFGSWGEDVFRCDDERDLTRVLELIETRHWFRAQGALVQELVPPVGYDLRLLVAGSRVVGAVERVARPGDWRTNVSLGGTRRSVVPDARACTLGLRAVAATRTGLSGVDLIPSGDGYLVLEVNGAVEFDSTYDLPAADVYEAAARALELPTGQSPGCD